VRASIELFGVDANGVATLLITCLAGKTLGKTHLNDGRVKSGKWKGGEEKYGGLDF
jgi:hypothetical protein